MSWLLKQNGIIVKIRNDRRIEWITQKNDRIAVWIEDIDQYHGLRKSLCPYEVNLHESQATEDLIQDEMCDYIIEELTGRWCCIQGLVFSFELEIAAMIFKLRWM